jgi:hypothetical protein
MVDVDANNRFGLFQSFHTASSKPLAQGKNQESLKLSWSEFFQNSVADIRFKPSAPVPTVTKPGQTSSPAPP